MNNIKTITKVFIPLVIFIFFTSPAWSTPVSSQFTGWQTFADDDNVGAHGYVNPGWGGQDFDAEYLLYKLDGDILSIGLQTGFNVDTGVVIHGMTYYSGDLQFSLTQDGDTNVYAADFGFNTRDYNNATVGGQPDTVGVYGDVSWGGNIYFSQSGPFAMESGNLLIDESDPDFSTATGYDTGLDTYWRTVSFGLDDLGIDMNNQFVLAAHWTMSCGNDAIDGQAFVPQPVPEPATYLLLGSGLVGLICFRKKKRQS